MYSFRVSVLRRQREYGSSVHRVLLFLAPIPESRELLEYKLVPTLGRRRQ